MLYPQNPTKILVFLPKSAGATIVARLVEHGFQATSVSTIPEAFDALRSNDFDFAITTRPDIDLLRNIRPVPVINLEVFFHAGVESDGNAAHSKRFDSKAFLERVEFLARTRQIQNSKEQVVRSPCSFRQRATSDGGRLQQMRITHNSKVAIDVHS